MNAAEGRRHGVFFVGRGDIQKNLQF